MTQNNPQTGWKQEGPNDWRTENPSSGLIGIVYCTELECVGAVMMGGVTEIICRGKGGLSITQELVDIYLWEHQKAQSIQVISSDATQQTKRVKLGIPVGPFILLV